MMSEGVRVFTAVCNIIAGVISVVAMVVSIRARNRAEKAAQDIRQIRGFSR
jgi:hypothetical protein